MSENAAADDIVSESDETSNLLSYRNFAHAFSGTVASVFSITVLFPFETVRTRLQVDDKRESKLTLFVLYDIARAEGFWRLYQGWWSLIVSNSVSNFIYFYVFNCLRLFVLSSESDLSVVTDLISGILAGFATVLLSNPLWVINTRLKLQGVVLERSSDGRTANGLPRYKGIFDCLCSIVANEGLPSLWDGVLTSLLLATNPAINFMVYEALKRHVLQLFELWISAGALYFVFGGISKLTATLLTYPLQLIQTRARAGIAIPSLLHMTLWQRVCTMYRGVESKLTQTVLTSALSLTTYEFIVSKVFQLLHGS